MVKPIQKRQALSSAVLPDEPVPSSILIVDDVPDNLRLLSTALALSGHEVRSAINGAVALMSAEVEPPDLILLDVTMPSMDGFEVCRRLKEKASTADIPIIFISALGGVIDKVAAFEVGGVDYVTKPFQTDEVIARVNSQLELVRLKQQLQYKNQQLQDSLQEQHQAAAQVRQLNSALEERVTERTQQLLISNQTLQVEIQEHQQAQKKLLQLAMYDPLTGLANRTLFLDGLEQALKQGQQGDDQPQQTVAVVLFYCARFEAITVTLGHRQEDQLLIQIANRLAKTVPEGSLVARLRGDEFAVLLKMPLNLEEFVTTVQQALAVPIELGKHKLFITPSFGIALSSNESDEAEHLLRNAYQAMAQAKKQAIGCWRLFEPDMHQQALRRLELESKLRQAIQEQQFQLRYQPIVTLSAEPAGCSVVGFEALVRWQPSSDSKLISPMEFIPLAEETGLIVPLGNFVFETACKQIGEWNRERSSEEELFMSVNFSVHQLNQENVAQQIESVIEKTNIKPHWLKLEITESVLMANPKSVLDALEKLRTQGIQVSLDDFGTGYSSLGYLRDLPVDILKIDRAFIKNINSNEDDVRILEAILSLSRALELDVVAEGIETQFQADCLTQLGSQYGQGYRFAKPLDSTAAAALLSEGLAS